MALINVTKKIEKARDNLGMAGDERVVAACMTNPKGAMKRSVAVGIGGALGAAVASKVDANTEPTQTRSGLADRFVPGQNALVLTEDRLFMAKISALSGKPKEIVASWDRDEVETISVEENKLSFPMTITFVDQTVVEFEGAKGTDPRALAI